MLTVIGEALVDLVAEPDNRRFTAHCGGSPLNVAVGLARLAQPSSLMARFGQDTFGRQLRAYAEANGVGLAAAIDAAEPSTLAVVSLDEQARASYDFWVEATADWQWSRSELSRLPAGTRVLHTGSLASWTPPGDAAIAELLARLRQEGQVLLSYDPNVRPRLLATPAYGRELVERNVRLAHVVKASDEDTQWLYPDLDPASVARNWLELGAQVVVVTAGPGGATAYLPTGESVHRAGRAVQVVDTVGAGDAFMAGLLDALSRHGIDAPDRLTRLTQSSTLIDVLDDAILVAALTCERAGADPPTRAQLDARRTN